VADSCVEDYNNTIHSVTGYTPKYLLNGSVTKNLIPNELHEVSDLADDRKKALENSLRHHLANKARFDRHRQHAFLDVSDLVFIEKGNKLNRAKLDEIRMGPYPITKKISNNVFEIDVGYKSAAKRLYHVSKMVPLARADRKMS